MKATPLPIPAPYTHKPLRMLSPENPSRMTNPFDIEQELDALDKAEAKAKAEGAPASPGLRAGEIWSSTT